MRGGWQPASPLGRAQTAWDEIGRVWEEVIGAHGSYIVERTTVVSLKAGVLTVSCSESVVADTLELESERVLERLNERLGGRSDHAPAMRYRKPMMRTRFFGYLQAKQRAPAGRFRGRYVLFFCTPSFDAPAREQPAAVPGRLNVNRRIVDERRRRRAPQY